MARAPTRIVRGEKPRRSASALAQRYPSCLSGTASAGVKDKVAHNQSTRILTTAQRRSSSQIHVCLDVIRRRQRPLGPESILPCARVNTHRLSVQRPTSTLIHTPPPCDA
ncbi:hypothetical protein VTO73DRAFT_10604 [Trametes versicolor]